MAVNDEIMNNLAQYEGGNVNERIYNFLGNLGYTGALSDRLARYSSEGRKGWQGLLEDLGIWTPAQLFSQGDQGLFFVPKPVSFGSQFLYQDSAGTTLTDANGDPVGLGLEWSRGLELGPELVTNGTFDNDLSGWTAATGWSWDSGKARVVTDTANVILSQGLSLPPAGKAVVIELDATIVSGTLVANFSGTGSPDYVLEEGHNKIIRVMDGSESGSFDIRTVTSGPWEAEIDNISVRELPGNHLTQSVSADRPTYGTDGTLHWLGFDGAGDYLISLPSNALQIPFTMAAVFSPDEVTSSNSGAYRIVSRGDASSTRGAISVDGGQVYINLDGAAGIQAGAVGAGDTVQVVCRFLSDRTVVTLNGVETTYFDFVSQSANPAPIAIGKQTESPSRYFDGKISAVVLVDDDVGADGATKLSQYFEGIL